MFVPVKTKTHNQQKPFYFGGSNVPIVLDIQSSSIHGAGTKETPPVPRRPVLHHTLGTIPHQKGKKITLK